MLSSSVYIYQNILDIPAELLNYQFVFNTFMFFESSGFLCGYLPLVLLRVFVM